MTRRSPRFTWQILQWPRPLDWDTAHGFMHRLVADPNLGPVAIETRADQTQIEYRIGATKSHISALQALACDLVPGVQISPPDTDRRPIQVAAKVLVTHPTLALETSRVEALTRAVLAGMSGLKKGEQVVLQLLIGSRLTPSLATGATAHQSWWSLLNHGVKPASRQEINRFKAKCTQHGSLATLRIGASAANHQRAKQIVQQLFGGLRMAEAAGVRLRLAPDKPERLNQTRRPWRYPLRLAAAEMACLAAWPIGDKHLPGLPPISPRSLPPPTWMSNQQTQLGGRVFATSASNQGIKIGIPPADSLLHTVLLGPTGAGKSTAIEHLALADIKAGAGVVVIDPKNDLVTDLLERIPPSRAHDVVVLDPTDPNPVGFNPLAEYTTSPELHVDSILASLKAIFADSWGVRTEEILTAALITLAKTAHQAARSLVAIPSLLTSPALRRVITSSVHDPLGVSAFWAKYHSWSPEQRATIIAPVLNKLQQFVIRPRMRAILGQTQPRFHLADIFTKRRILLVSLNKGLIGPESARLLGSLIVGHLWPLILGRSKLPANRRHLTSIYVDEVHDFINAIPGDLADALAQSRSLGVAWTMAHQYRHQLSPAMCKAIDANARNKIYFGLSATDARDIARNIPQLEAADFIRLPQFHIYSNTRINGQETGWISGVTQPPTPARQTALDLKAQSSRNYGTPAEDTEAALSQLAIAPKHHQDSPIFGRKPVDSADQPPDQPQPPP